MNDPRSSTTGRKRSAPLSSGARLWSPAAFPPTICFAIESDLLDVVLNDRARFLEKRLSQAETPETAAALWNDQFMEAVAEHLYRLRAAQLHHSHAPPLPSKFIRHFLGPQDAEMGRRNQRPPG